MGQFDKTKADNIERARGKESTNSRTRQEGRKKKQRGVLNKFNPEDKKRVQAKSQEPACVHACTNRGGFEKQTTFFVMSPVHASCVRGAGETWAWIIESSEHNIRGSTATHEPKQRPVPRAGQGVPCS